MSEIDMTPAKVSQRLRRVAQLRRLCLKLSLAGKKREAAAEGGSPDMVSCSEIQSSRLSSSSSTTMEQHR